MANCPNTDRPCSCPEACEMRGCLDLDPPLIGGPPTRVCPATGGQCGIGCTSWMNCPRIATTLLASVPSGPPGYDSDSKPTNPKDLIGSGKLPLHLWPATATAMGCVGLAEGMLKYGRSNWRVAGARASIYVDACLRHLFAYFEGEDVAPDSGVPHLANALACLAILVDAEAAGKLTDDRQVPGGYRALVETLTPHVERLKALHADKAPKHYTIADGGVA